MPGRNARATRSLQQPSKFPAEDYRRISGSLETLPLILKDVLQNPGEPIEHVCFPGGGFCSIVTVLDDGSMVEVAKVGREGLSPIAAASSGL